MSTILQEKLADRYVQALKEGKKMTKEALLVSAGYTPETADASAKRTFEQKGVQEALKKRGFHPDAAKDVVSEIMHNPEAKDENRLRAASEVFKVHGSYAAEKTVNLALTGTIDQLAKLDERTLLALADGATLNLDTQVEESTQTTQESASVADDRTCINHGVNCQPHYKCHRNDST